MDNEFLVLAATAASIGLFHTLFGPDHYLPFIVMGKARKWSLAKTILITFLCGLGHVAGSVVLGAVGVGLGLAVGGLESLEAIRGDLAAWLLIGFGGLYMLWGLYRAFKNRPHTHSHIHVDGTVHEHGHDHRSEHAHVHGEPRTPKLTPWVLFVIFALGPCEPLIPILIYPAMELGVIEVILIAAIFSAVTIATMTSVVIAGWYGMSFLPMGRLERYVHALAGGAICMSGLAITFLGL
jgi:nickel/cobalt transporter (NicO) family protein